MADFIKEFTQKLQNANYGMHHRDIFSDFLTLSANAFANIIYKDEELEKEYLDIISKYKNPSIFSELLAMIANEFERENFQDLMGKIYMQGNFGNSNAGQFFTPFHVSDMMAQITIYEDDLKKKIQEHGYITVCDPCVGAGGMIIAAAKTIYNLGYNSQQTMFFSATDIDKRCVEMTLIQTSLLGLCGEINWGDTISLKTWRTYRTMFYYSDPWQVRFFVNDIKDIFRKTDRIISKNENSNTQAKPKSVKQPEKVDLIVDNNGQIKLF